MFGKENDRNAYKQIADPDEIILGYNPPADKPARFDKKEKDTRRSKSTK